MSKSRYAVILHPETPQLLLEGLKNYVFEAKGFRFFLSYETVSAEYPMTSMSIVKKGSKNELWEIQLPSSYILLICKMSDGKTPLGFIDNKKPA